MEKKITAKKPAATKTTKTAKPATKKAPAKKPVEKKVPVKKVNPIQEAMLAIGACVQMIRIGKGLSTIKLGEMAGVGARTIRDFEAGKTNPKFDTIVKIVDALGYTFDIKMK